MEVSETSLANLVPGPKGGRFAGVDLIIAAIAETVAPEFADDEAVRFELNKVFDFVVTPAVRAAVVERKARRIFNAIFKIMRDQVVSGDVVSVNGFATIWRDKPDEGWPIGIERLSHSMRPIKPNDIKIRETRTAAVMPGNWTGQGLAAEYKIEGMTYPEGTTHIRDSVNEPYTLVNGSVIAVSGAVLGLFNSATVTAVGSDGVSRQYPVGSLSIVVYVERQLRPVMNQYGGVDLQMYYLPVVDQAARLAAARVGKSAAEIEKNLGFTVAMGVGEWWRVVDREVSSLEPVEISWEGFRGIPADKIMAAYPRVSTVIRVYSSVYDVRRIAQEVYRANFGFQEAYLKSIGAWPERSRNTGNIVSVDFRQEFIDAIQ